MFVLKTVYLLRSLSNPQRTYVGVTTDFDRRLEEHNSGRAPHTVRFKPWKIVVVVEFSNDTKADLFEAYLKSGSGHAFARKRFW
jgi:predicted GIY-YIG superfamily endonuclease